jgi:hypothetical protein
MLLEKRRRTRNHVVEDVDVRLVKIIDGVQSNTMSVIAEITRLATVSTCAHSLLTTPNVQFFSTLKPLDNLSGWLKAFDASQTINRGLKCRADLDEATTKPSTSNCYRFQLNRVGDYERTIPTHKSLG